MKTLLRGVAWIIAASLFVLSRAGNPMNELALIQRAQVASGLVVETETDVAETDDSRRAGEYLKATYTYLLPDGRKFTHGTDTWSGRFSEGDHIEVEYLSDNPEVCRIKGDGCTTVMEWFWRKVLLGLVLLAMFGFFGVKLVRDGIRELRGIRSYEELETIAGQRREKWCRENPETLREIKAEAERQGGGERGARYLLGAIDAAIAKEERDVA